MGKMELISGTVYKVVEYADGRVICLIPSKASTCANWTILPIWQPRQTYVQAGVISLWRTNSGKGCPLMPEATPAAQEEKLVCTGALRDGHTLSPWDARQWSLSKSGPWVLIRGENLYQERDVTLCAASLNRTHQPPYAHPEVIRLMSRIYGTVNIVREYVRALNVVYVNQPYSMKSLLAGIYASGRTIYELYPNPEKALWSGVYRREAVNEAEMDWHAFFLGYHLGHANWGEVARQCHDLAYHKQYGAQGVYDRLIPTFAKLIYQEGRSQQTFGSFVAALSGTWFQG
jgi:hypothetical protein